MESSGFWIFVRPVLKYWDSNWGGVRSLYSRIVSSALRWIFFCSAPDTDWCSSLSAEILKLLYYGIILLVFFCKFSECINAEFLCNTIFQDIDIVQQCSRLSKADRSIVDRLEVRSELSLTGEIWAMKTRIKGKISIDQSDDRSKLQYSRNNLDKVRREVGG